MKRTSRTLRIGEVATRYRLHPQTLRLYEREGLLVPSRSRGNNRAYDEADLRRLECILNLSRELGVNLAGIGIILHMRERLQELQGEVLRLETLAGAQWREGTALASEVALVPAPPRPIARAPARMRSWR